jgi:hypothetical protein
MDDRVFGVTRRQIEWALTLILDRVRNERHRAFLAVRVFRQAARAGCRSGIMARLLERECGRDELVRTAWRAIGFSSLRGRQRVDVGLGKSRVSDGAWGLEMHLGTWAGTRIGTCSKA